ncbi:MAG: DUF305 domain-containing protein, partial [Actinomycetes bacterium]
MKKTLTLSAAAIAAAITLAGCSTGSGTSSPESSSMSGMDHGSSGMSSSSAPATSAAAAAEFNDADTMFAQMMIPHHKQAIAMSDLMLKKDGIPAAVTDLATKIKAAQGPEIEKMTGWLQSWGQPTEMPTDIPSSHSMEGMM